MSFDKLTINGDYSDYDILEEEQETISSNGIVWVKVKKAIWQGRVIKIPYIIKEEDSEHLTIKWTDSQKDEWVLININYRLLQKRVSVPTHQCYNRAYTEEKIHDLTTKTRQRKINDNY